MELLKLVLVDDEPILLQGLVQTYDWESMGFTIVGTAKSGQQALEVIRKEKPDVVLTDIRMKQVTGLMVIDEISKENPNCLFIVLSAYRNFQYAQQAVELGAFAYLLKPIEEDKLRETMQKAYHTCMEQRETETRIENWEKLLAKDQDSFLQVVIEKYAKSQITQEKIQNIFDTINMKVTDSNLFLAVCVDVDLTYKITNALNFEAARYELIQYFQEKIKEKYTYWHFEGEEDNEVFVIAAERQANVYEVKKILEHIKKEQKNPVIAAISKPFRGVTGIRECYLEAQHLFGVAAASGASAFTIPEDVEESHEESYATNEEALIINAVRKNDADALKKAFIGFIYKMPKSEEMQCQYLHKVMLKTEFMIRDSYGMTEELYRQFQDYYSNLKNLNSMRASDVCYKIMKKAIAIRENDASKDETRYFKEYMSDAVAYIEEHLEDETLSIVSVATHVYLNPVYFGRVFKNTFHMTFKKYLLQQRMEKAKQLLESGKASIGNICEMVGIGNPSYFSHLFKEYTGKMPSEYKKEYEV